jgi:hypothetical protein
MSWRKNTRPVTKCLPGLEGPAHAAARLHPSLRVRGINLLNMAKRKIPRPARDPEGSRWRHMPGSMRSMRSLVGFSPQSGAPAQGTVVRAGILRVSVTADLLQGPPITENKSQRIERIERILGEGGLGWVVRFP